MSAEAMADTVKPLNAAEFFESARMNRRPERGVNIRLLSPWGDYPVHGFRHPEGALVLENDVCAILTRFRKVEMPEDYYSEIEFLSPFEVRLLASVILSRDIESGATCIYPVQENLELSTPDVDLSDETTLQKLISEFRAHITAVRPYRDVHKPPLVGGPLYSFNEHADFRSEHQHEIFRAIDVSDHLMIRGLGALIRAGMLFAHCEFTESAGMSLWVAMEASLEIVKRVLRTNGIENPSARDAGEFLDNAFESEWESDGYFTDSYEDRIKTIHPASRYGVFPGACLSVSVRGTTGLTGAAAGIIGSGLPKRRV
jgi:hypothetical protein